jgi:hypothetical protein
MSKTDSTAVVQANLAGPLFVQTLLDEKIAEVKGEISLFTLPAGSENIQLRMPSPIAGKEYSWGHPLSYILSRSNSDWYYLTWQGQLVVMHFDKHEDGSDHHYGTIVDTAELATSQYGVLDATDIIRGLEMLLEKVRKAKG